MKKIAIQQRREISEREAELFGDHIAKIIGLGFEVWILDSSENAENHWLMAAGFLVLAVMATPPLLVMKIKRKIWGPK